MWFGGHFVFWQSFCLSNFVQTVHTNFHAKSGICRSKNEWFMLNFEIWWPFCFSKKSKFVQTVHTNFHAKSGVSNSKNERVIINLVFSAIPLIIRSLLCLKASRWGHLLHRQISSVPDVPQILFTPQNIAIEQGIYLR